MNSIRSQNLPAHRHRRTRRQEEARFTSANDGLHAAAKADAHSEHVVCAVAGCGLAHDRAVARLRGVNVALQAGNTTNIVQLMQSQEDAGIEGAQRSALPDTDRLDSRRPL
jgi:hypothetical protein